MKFTCREEDLRLYAYGFLEPAEAAVLESHLEGCTECREDLRALNHESILVAFELSLDPGENVAEPQIEMRSPRGRLRRILPVAAAAAATVLFLIVLGSVLLAPDRPAAPEAPVEPVADHPDRTVPADPDALASAAEREELLKRLAELERQVRQLTAARAPGPVVPPAERIGRAVERHDWAGLASALAGVAPEIAEGRMPSDTDLLRAYLEALEALRALAAAAGTPATVKEAARDPRTGPLLFFAALKRNWPSAPEQDLDAATSTAQSAMEDYQDAVAAAETPVERAIAETVLNETLAAEVRKLSETQGPPTATPVTAPTQEAKPEEAPSDAPVRVVPVNTTEPATDTAPPSVVESSTSNLVVGTVLSSAGVPPVGDRIYRGTRPVVAGQVVAGWRTDFDFNDSDSRMLTRLAETWVARYDEVLARTAPDVVLAFEARLGRGTAPRGVSEDELRRLRDTLLALQVKAEQAVLNLDPPSRPESALRTFFLFE